MARDRRGREWDERRRNRRERDREQYDDYAYEAGEWNDRGAGPYGDDRGRGPRPFTGDYYNRGLGWFGRGFGLGMGAGMGPLYGRPFGPDYGTDARDIGYGGTGSDLTPEDDVSGYARGRYDRGPHAGRGPEGYRRSDERIEEDVCDNLTWHGLVDARRIKVSVKGGEVTLEGTIDSRRAKRMAEDAAEDVRGVVDVHNRLRIEAGE